MGQLDKDQQIKELEKELTTPILVAVNRLAEALYAEREKNQQIKELRDELRKSVIRYSFREGQLIEAFKSYIEKYGPGYTSTDHLAYDNAQGVLAAVLSDKKRHKGVGE